MYIYTYIYFKSIHFLISILRFLNNILLIIIQIIYYSIMYFFTIMYFNSLSMINMHVYTCIHNIHACRTYIPVIYSILLTIVQYTIQYTVDYILLV